MSCSVVAVSCVAVVVAYLAGFRSGRKRREEDEAREAGPYRTPDRPRPWVSPPFPPAPPPPTKRTPGEDLLDRIGGIRDHGELWATVVANQDAITEALLDGEGEAR